MSCMLAAGLAPAALSSASRTTAARLRSAPAGGAPGGGAAQGRGACILGCGGGGAAARHAGNGWATPGLRAGWRAGCRRRAAGGLPMHGAGFGGAAGSGVSRRRAAFSAREPALLRMHSWPAGGRLRDGRMGDRTAGAAVAVHRPHLISAAAAQQSFGTRQGGLRGATCDFRPPRLRPCVPLASPLGKGGASCRPAVLHSRPPHAPWAVGQSRNPPTSTVE